MKESCEPGMESAVRGRDLTSAGRSRIQCSCESRFRVWLVALLSCDGGSGDDDGGGGRRQHGSKAVSFISASLECLTELI